MSSVIVFGSINMDIVSSVEEFPKAGETIFGQALSYFPGGKGANQAIAAAKAGAETFIFGSIGTDGFGETLKNHLASSGVHTDFITRSPKSPTGTALINVNQSGENTIIVIPGANSDLVCNDKNLSSFDSAIAVSQFEVPKSEIIKFFKLMKQKKGTTILNPSPYASVDPELLSVTDILILNEHEFQSMTGFDIISKRPDSLPPEKFIVPIFIVTLGALGVGVFEKDKPATYFSGHSVQVVDTTGAGDCFTGSLAACLAKGEAINRAVAYANAAAALSTTIMGAGTSAPHPDQVKNLIVKSGF